MQRMRRTIRAEAKYLRYVVRHKFYVVRAGLAIARVVGLPFVTRWMYPLWVLRLLVHDFSKLSVEEWGPYVETFYGEPTTTPEAKRDRQAAFNAAWLHHIHANPHHWQHWILHEDSGKTIVLLPPSYVLYEMVADWLAAGPKALRRHTMAEAVAETIVWYAKTHEQRTMRLLAKETAEHILLTLAEHYGVASAAQEIDAARNARASLVIPGR